MKNILTNPTVLRASIAAASFSPFGVRAADNCPQNVSNGNDLTVNQGVDCAKGNSSADSLFGSTGVFHQIANILIFLVGAVAVIMLIIGGLRYVISQGNKEGVSQAKDTILYSIIGIVVAILAYAIVNFVTGSLAPSGSS